MNDKSSGAELVFLIFAILNEKMMEISHLLRANPNVKTIASAFDIRRFRDFMTEQPVLHLDAYVEAETLSEDRFLWSLRLKKTPASWEIHRIINREETWGGNAMVSFEDAVFDEIVDLADRFLPLIEEFVDSAKSFDFLAPPQAE